jgi:hypothetical protein
MAKLATAPEIREALFYLAKDFDAVAHQIESNSP